MKPNLLFPAPGQRYRLSVFLLLVLFLGACSGDGKKPSASANANGHDSLAEAANSRPAMEDVLRTVSSQRMDDVDVQAFSQDYMRYVAGAGQIIDLRLFSVNDHYAAIQTVYSCGSRVCNQEVMVWKLERNGQGFRATDITETSMPTAYNAYEKRKGHLFSLDFGPEVIGVITDTLGGPERTPDTLDVLMWSQEEELKLISSPRAAAKPQS